MRPLQTAPLLLEQAHTTLAAEARNSAGCSGGGEGAKGISGPPAPPTRRTHHRHHAAPPARKEPHCPVVRMRRDAHFTRHPLANVECGPSKGWGRRAGWGWAVRRARSSGGGRPLGHRARDPPAPPPEVRGGRGGFAYIMALLAVGSAAGRGRLRRHLQQSGPDYGEEEDSRLSAQRRRAGAEGQPRGRRRPAPSPASCAWPRPLWLATSGPAPSAANPRCPAGARARSGTAPSPRLAHLNVVSPTSLLRGAGEEQALEPRPAPAFLFLMEAPLPAAPSVAAAPQEERRRKLQEYLAAKGKVKVPSTKPYLKDKTNQQKQPASSKPELAVKWQKKVIPSTGGGAQARETQWSVPAGQGWPGRSSRASASQKPKAATSQCLTGKKVLVQPPPSLPSARLRSEKLSCTGASSSSSKCPLRQGRESRKREAAPAPRSQTHSLADRSHPLKKWRGQAEYNRENLPAWGGAPPTPQQQKGVLRPGLKAETRLASKQAVKKSSQAVGWASGSKRPEKGPARPSPAAEAQCQAPARGPAAALGGRACGGSVARPALSRPVMKSRDRRAAGVLGREEGLTGRRAAAQSRSREASAELQRGPSKLQADACQVLQERRRPKRSAWEVERRSKRERRHSVACGGTHGHGSPAGKSRCSHTLGPPPRTSGVPPRHLVSAQAALGALGRGRGLPEARQPAAGAGQELRTPRTQDRRQLLAQWLASQGKSYKRPPMTLPAKKPQEAQRRRSLAWRGLEEEEEQLSLAEKVTSLLREYLQLAEEGFPAAELLDMLSRTPEAERFAQFWICKAKLLARLGPFDVIGLYEAALCARAAPIQELRDVVLEMLKHAGKTAQAPLAEARPLPEEKWAEPSTPQAGQGPVSKPLSAVKLQVAPLLRTKEPGTRPAVKLLTPVRRSLRIEGAAAGYPPMLKDHDPLVSSLDELLATDTESRFVFRKNEALSEEVGRALLGL
ncbi:cytoskeleton-associated protein 2-like [Hemicordylus capensis]|uniref:cytoskeleton-associated protein 2-like n=1 Tax=Hemicordylus capensis TaxID=884348 RepID=UPI002302E5D1|nr:cytoskeleton-associated protein 2-like [Hemicordylus capensis]